MGCEIDLFFCYRKYSFAIKKSGREVQIYFCYRKN